MVKADVKRDYYADLELPATADNEEVKRQFRLLAKQYHPDRNPGHEVEVVPKFQAVQAAHEILSDPLEKAKYDAGRAKLAAKHAASASPAYSPDPYSFSRPTYSKPAQNTKQQFPFPPPPKTPTQRSQQANQRPQASAGADKFNAFTRGPPQSWDRGKFDEARAEAARAFPNLRPTSSAQQMPPPPPPPRTNPRAPTAPRPSPNPEMPHVPNVPPTSFPGLSRAASSRGNYSASDSQQGSRSAFSYVQGTRAQQQPSPHLNVHDHYTSRSPPTTRARPSVSPLRHTRSSDYDMRQDIGSRPPSRYAGGVGERLDLHGDGLHRTSSVRNSPVDDRGPFGRPTARFENLPRHRSASPGIRETGSLPDFSASSSEEDVGIHMNARPKATPRPRPNMRSNLSYDAENNPGLTGQYPRTNYTRIVEENPYRYPAPEAKEPTRKPFPDMTSPNVEHAGPYCEAGGGMDTHKYASPAKAARSWSQTFTRGHRAVSFNGFAPWAVPASVFPQTTPPRTRSDATTENQGFAHLWNNRADSVVSNPAVPPNAQTTFDAAKWQAELNADNIFRPDETQMRKSPSKTSRTGGKPVVRGRAQSRATEELVVSPEPGSEDKSAAFQPGKLADDFATRATGKATHTRLGSGNASSADSRDRYVVVEEEDAMDVDTPSTNGYHGPSSNGVKHGKVETPKEQKRRSSHGGVDLSDFIQHAPFAPTSTGLSGMKDDLETHLPFESRAEKNVNLHRTASARIRALDLPKPPKGVVPPADDRLDKNNFDQYVQNMQEYMRLWNIFNAKMIEHFRSRQDRICGTMSQAWIGQSSDGPDADTMDQAENGTKQAGYAAYMQWMKDDAQCRDWWEEANAKHLSCMEDLGRTREVAKRKLPST